MNEDYTTATFRKPIRLSDEDADTFLDAIFERWGDRVLGLDRFQDTETWDDRDYSYGN